jgi:adenosylcobinamide kinase/adenosylcobinamide-phosphate guanylyltransferase
MKVTFIGTGAADWPLKRNGDMTEFRRLSSALIDDVMLIDPGPQVLEGLIELKKAPEKIKYIINTHSHGDHFSPETVEKLEALNARFIPLTAGEQVTLDKYTVIALQGNHSTAESIVHFIITDNERTLFYGLDGAWLLYGEYQAIKKYAPDFAVLDGTVGFGSGDFRIFEHNDLNMVLEMKETLKAHIKTFCISHMARTLHTDHRTLSEEMKKHDVIVAFDGFETEI